MNYQIREVIHKEKLKIPKDVILENAFDPYHVERVHYKTVKSVKIIHDNGDTQLLLYELYSFPFFRFLSFFTNKFIVLKTATKNDVTFYTIPTKLPFVSKSKISCLPNKNFTDYTLKFQFKPFNLIYSIFSSLIIKMRNYGENIRLKEDMELMELRAEALKEDHTDNPRCIDEPTLLNKWFK